MTHRYSHNSDKNTSMQSYRYLQEIGTICLKDTCLAAQTTQSLAIEGLELYPMSVRLNQLQPETQTIVQ
jgi:hypothetical protein